MFHKTRLRTAIKAFSIHAVLSALVAILTGIIIFGYWFPFPFRELAGGEHLFWTLVGIDMVCGPILTAILFNPQKSRRALWVDLALIAAIQLGALLYGLDSISNARPVILAFEVDRFAVVAAGHINQQTLATTPHRLPWDGPMLVGTRAPKNSNEVLASIEQSIQGSEPSARPDWWQPYDTSRPEVKLRMRPLSILYGKQSIQNQRNIDEAARKIGRDIGKIYYLPLVSHKSLDDWIVLLDDEAHIIAYFPVDGF